MDVYEDIDILFDADLINVIEEINPHRTYTVRERRDHFNFWNDQEFFNRFRLSKATVELLFNEIQEHLHHRTGRNLDRAIRPMDQLLLTLRFLATGDFYICTGDFLGVHKSTAAKIVQRVVTAICTLRRIYIFMPNTEEQRHEKIIKFHNLAQFPRVIGAIDCTHIKLQSPGGERAELFRCRKGFFSLNVQVICDASHKILDVVTRWPGSTHDAHIFQNSSVYMRFENGEMGNGILLGDSGYPSRRYLLTPIHNPEGQAENLYNESQIRTRNVVERTFGIWKRRFPVLSVGIRCRLNLAQRIVVACAILHNIACQQNEEVFEGDDEEDQPVVYNGVENNDGGVEERETIIGYFRNMLTAGGFII